MIDYIKNNLHISLNILLISIIIVIFIIAILSSDKENFISDIESKSEHKHIISESHHVQEHILNNLIHTTIKNSESTPQEAITLPHYSYTSVLATKTDSLLNKIINFSCTVNGKTYFLANSLIKSCKNKTEFVPECDEATVILIDEPTINTELIKYTDSLRNNEIACQKQNSIKNKTICKQHRMYIHDFKLNSVGIVGSNTYIIRGTAIPLLNGQNHPTMINQSISQIHDLNTICGGDYGYGVNKNENNYAEISIVSVGTNNNLDNCLLKMTSNVVLKGVNGKPAVKIMDGNKNKTITTYFAIDTSNNCNLYNRIKLVTDINDKNILHFKVYIVS